MKYHPASQCPGSQWYLSIKVFPTARLEDGNRFFFACFLNDLFLVNRFIILSSADDFTTCLQRFKAGLKKGGVICIKDNVAGAEAVFDDCDSSVTRQV